jgi:hypothetical protein
MPAGPDETDNHPAGSLTEDLAQNASSKTESNASTHPIHGKSEPQGDKVEFRHHQANPGPAIPSNLNVQQEGTKEERRAKAEASKISLSSPSHYVMALLQSLVLNEQDHIALDESALSRYLSFIY